MEDFVTFEIAKKLKEKGYPQHIAEDAYIIDNYGENEYQIGDRLPIPLIPDYMDDIAAPIISQVLKWLREVQGYNVNMRIFSRDGWYWNIQDRNGNPCYYHFTLSDDLFDTYENAALAAIEYVLDNLI